MNKTIKILDLGCGRGAKINSLEKRGKVTGIDISLESINVCKKLFPKSNFIVMDALNLKFKSGCFDEIYCMDVIEHVDNPQILLENINRVLKPTGTLFLDIPYYKSEKLLTTFNPTYSQQIHHQTVFPFTKIISLLNNTHFKIQKCQYTKFFDNIYLLSYFLRNKKIKNQQGDFSQKNDSEQLMSYIVQHVYTDNTFKKVTELENYSKYNEISENKFNLPLIDLLKLAKLSDELISPLFPKTISLKCESQKNPNNKLSDLKSINNYKNVHNYSSEIIMNELYKKIDKIKIKNRILEEKQKIILDSKLFKLWPIYTSIKKNLNIFQKK